MFSAFNPSKWSSHGGLSLLSSDPIRIPSALGSRGVASFSKVRGMDVVCLLTIKKMNSMTEGYKRYNIQDIKSFPFK